jgi:hypothetical protein
MKTIRHATANVLGYTAFALIGLSLLLAWVAMQIDGGQDKGEAA